MQTAQLNQFNFSEELHKTLVNTLATSFGLDFLLANDKVGGDVDTIHNVRQGVYATEKEKQIYKDKPSYDKDAYHAEYLKDADGNSTKTTFKNVKDKTSRQKASGELIDAYTGQKMQAEKSEKKDVDHVISSYKIDNDPGRVLAELSGIELANHESNLVATNSSINKAKQALDIEDFIKVIPERIQQRKIENVKLKEKLNNPDLSPEKKQEIEIKIAGNENYIAALEKTDPNLMREQHKKSEAEYEKKINIYYKSTKFFKNTALAAGKEGLMMGTRQAMGLLLAEVWFELKEQIPAIYHRCRENFTLERFLEDIKNVLNNIWKRVKARFSDMLIAFKDGAISGVMSNINKTVLNIFSTTSKLISKLLREVWGSLVKAVKLVFFNPNKLPLGDLSREVTRLLSTAVAVGTGAMISTHLDSMWSAAATFPLLKEFSSEIANFIGALTTGVLTIGFTYFLDHSALMQKVWDFLNSAKSKYELSLEYYQQINAELDRYLTELSRIEFNMNVDELSAFATELSSINDEYKLNAVLGEEINRRGIDLPFEMGNTNSMRDFLKTKCKKN